MNTRYQQEWTRLSGHSPWAHNEECQSAVPAMPQRGSSPPTVPPLSKLSGTDTYKKSWPCKNYDSLSNPILLHVELHSNAYIQCKCQHTWIKVSQSIAYIPFTTWKALHLKAWHIPSRLPSPHNSTIYHIQNPTNKLTTITVLINMQHVKSVYDWNHRLGDQS